jgi:hypothetical protein
MEQQLRDRREMNAELSAIKRVAIQNSPPPGIEPHAWTAFLRDAKLWVDPKTLRRKQ